MQRREERAKKLELDRYPLPPDPEEVRAARAGAQSRVSQHTTLSKQGSLILSALLVCQRQKHWGCSTDICGA